MKDKIIELEALFRAMSSYQQIFEAYRLMFGEDEYAGYSALRKYRDEVELLDQINFSRELFIDPLPMSSIANALEVEPGYGTSSGELELGKIVKDFEAHRSSVYSESIGIKRPNVIHNNLDKTTVAIGNGVTGSLAIAIGSISNLDEELGLNRKKIYYSSPGYGMVDEIARIFKLNSIPYMGASDTHLPNLSRMVDTFDKNAIAYLLTYPTNPAQNSFTSEDNKMLTRLIKKCQEAGVFLIVDTIFQDMKWSGELAPEIFSLSTNARCLVKAFGPSKDRPFACGLRVGYMIGDERLRRHIDKLSSVLLNSHNFYSKLWLGIDLVLRKGSPSADDFRPFENNFILGHHGRSMKKNQIHEALQSNGIYNHYCNAIEHNSQVLNDEIHQVYEYLNNSPYFHPGQRPRFGNTLFVTLKETDLFKNDFDFFCQALFKKNIGLLVGSFFGLPEQWKQTSFRVVVASESAAWMIDKLQRIEELIEEN